MQTQQRRRRPGGRRFFPRRKVCQFCVDKVATIDYKDISRIRRFVSEWGKIESRRKTGTCAPHQRMLSLAIKRARYLAMLPYTGGHSQIELGRPDPRGDRARRPYPPREGQGEHREQAPRPAEAPAATATAEAPAAEAAPEAAVATPEAAAPAEAAAEAPAEQPATSEAAPSESAPSAESEPADDKNEQ